MKWRFKSNEIRVRLSPEDKADLIGGKVLVLEFTMGLKLILKAIDTLNAPELSFQNGKNTIALPSERILTWLNEDDMSMAFNTKGTRILLEKDLSCSHSSAPLDEKKFFGHKFE